VIKPSIVEVVSQRVELRKAGKEYKGLCPFHDDKHPSLSVNDDKGVFHCFACGERGDVFDFIMKLDGVTFPEAAKSLGFNSCRVTERRKPDAIKQRAAAALASWLNDQHLKVGTLLRDLARQIALAENIPDPELVESFTLEWEILGDLYEDLQNPAYAEELFRAKDSIESITQWAEPEPLPTFPELTPESRAHLAAAVKVERC
jgi:hypothetical protein